MLTVDQIREVYSRTSSTTKYREDREDRERRLERFRKWLLDVQGQGTDEEVRQGFLDHFESASQKLNPINRDRIIRDIPRFRAAVRELLNESIPVSERLDALLAGGGRHLEGMGPGLATEYLMIVYPETYCIWNNKSKSGLKVLDRWPVFKRGQSDGQHYERVLEAVRELRDQIGSPDFPDTDEFLHFVGAPEEEGQAALAAISQSKGSSPPAVADHPTSKPRSIWWVNQGDSFDRYPAHDFLWAPHSAADGSSRSFWSSLASLRPGHEVLNYSVGELRGYSIVEGEATTSRHPVEPDAAPWKGDGYLVKTRFTPFPKPVPLKQLVGRPDQGPDGPFDKHGEVKQGYLFPLDEAFRAWFAEKFPGYLPGDILAPESESVRDSSPTLPPAPRSSYVEPPFPEIVSKIHAAGFRMAEDVIRRYHLSLKSHRMVILSGVSGTGKSSLASKYASAVGARYQRISVAPNWTTNEDLLGYTDPIRGHYVDTDFSTFLRLAAAEARAAADAQVEPIPFHVLLDEMNLARVEYYFAKFLSTMEARGDNDERILELGKTPQDRIALPRNLYFIGTVNMDETTQGFSDKVLDRAQVIELPITEEDIRAHLGGKEYAEDLVKLWIQLRLVAPFAYRVLDDIAVYVEEATRLGRPWQSALDEQVLQKVLPKLNGADQRAEQVLKELSTVPAEKFPLSREKAESMLRRLVNDGVASYF